MGRQKVMKREAEPGHTRRNRAGLWSGEGRSDVLALVS